MGTGQNKSDLTCGEAIHDTDLDSRSGLPQSAAKMLDAQSLCAMTPTLVEMNDLVYCVLNISLDMRIELLKGSVKGGSEVKLHKIKETSGIAWLRQQS